MEKVIELLHACWSVLGQMSPYLIFGFLISGILSVMISPRWVEKHLGSGRISSIIKATMLGVPLPLCSCGVIPVSASLRRHGASKGATTAFLISTPQTGVDSFFATYSLLGPAFALFRPLAAMITGIIGGLAVSVIDEDKQAPSAAEIDQKNKDNENGHLSLIEKCREALRYAFITLPGEIARALIIGVIIAGLISTFISGDFVSHYIGNYYVTMLLMLVIGIPLYVCSTASIPIALGFMHMGVSPGAAFVFLISGPATNAAAISVVWKILGKTSAIIYLVTILIGSLTGGFVFDYLGRNFYAASMVNATQACHTTLSNLEAFSAIFMLTVLAISWYKARVDASCCSTCSANKTTSLAADLTITIEGMTCNHCAEAVKRAILEVSGVTTAQVILLENKALISGQAIDSNAVLNAVNSLGYTARTGN